MQPWVYVASKATSLTLVTFASGIAVAWVATDGVFDALRLVLALTLASTVAVLVGFTCVARAPSMNKLMITLLWVTTVAYLPLLLFFDVLPEPWGLVLAPLPSYAMLTSFSWAADPNLGFEAGLPALGYLLAWCVVGGWWAVREYTRSIVTGGR
jgi:hypothetical protein